ncbi:MAG TPA: glycosyltransferase family 87 protein [Steroidobacteraceae bacterium]|jgi:hypothetical protein|nr:glycosyltransferase family 87 protein [Steroidobacteraceae bacterium]
MSASEDTVLPALQQYVRVAGESDVVAAYRLPVYIACVVVALLTNYHLGRDLAWDTLNYHLYAGFSAVHNRFGQDFFPAGMQSYLNPYAYVPFYALVRAGLSALEISSILAVVQSGILWLIYELGLRVCPSEDRHTRVIVGICAVALAYVNPILMQQFGSTFADITTGELVVGGWLLLADAIRFPGAKRIVWAGLILGAATALKMTNSVHAAAGFAVLVMLPVAWRRLIRSGLIYCCSLAAGFVIVAAPWSWQLERTFGNPLFPLLNNVFRSPAFTTASLQHYRFIPDSFADALWRPFELMKPMFMVDEELRAPDLRYAVLALLLIALLLRWLWRRLGPRAGAAAAAPLAPAVRVLAALGCGVAADWTAWLTVSGNGRYFLPMACITAVVVIGLLFHLCANRPKVRNYVLVAMFAVQAVQLWAGTEFRWNPARWSAGQWLKIDVPRELARQPYLYLTLGVQSNSFVAPYLARGSGLVNISGDYVLSEQGAIGARIDGLIERYSPHVRMLVRGSQLYENRRVSPSRAAVDDTLSRFGLHADVDDCQRITVRGLPPDLQIQIDDVKPPPEGPPDTTYLISCRVVADHSDRSAEIADQRAAEMVLNRVEDTCPYLFQPRGLATEHVGHSWQRLYINTDLRLWVSRGWVKFTNPIRGDGVFFIGRESDWLKAPMRMNCGRRAEHYFATVIGSAPAGS